MFKTLSQVPESDFEDASRCTELSGFELGCVIVGWCLERTHGRGLQGNDVVA